jgi:Glycosyl-hydrolase family 116, catalytic region
MFRIATALLSISAMAAAQQGQFAANTSALLHAVRPEVALPDSLSHGRVPTGYSVGNFGIAAAVSADGLEITKSLINPPKQGAFLEPFASARLNLNADGRSSFRQISGYVVFPENISELVSPTADVTARIETLTPLSGSAQEDVNFENFIPAVMVQVTLTNHGSVSRRMVATYQVHSASVHGVVTSGTWRSAGSVVQQLHTNGLSQTWLMATADKEGRVAMRPTVDAVKPDMMGIRTDFTLEPGQTQRLWFSFGVHDPKGFSARWLPSLRDLQQYLLDGGAGARGEPRLGSFEAIKRQRDDFVAALPRTGDPEIDVYVRWYLSAAIFLTKGFANGDVLTMGYTAMNQRDSFWSSSPHLVYWPNLEARMLRESMAYQKPNGRVDNVLPELVREDAIDKTEYFILRVARYYRWYGDASMLKDALPHVRRAIDYLLSMDREGIGLPMQGSYWADWKDVPGVQGRAYAPHFDLLWLAALKEARWLAQEAGDSESSLRFEALFERASERLNRSTTAGGLWGGSTYTDVWRDGRRVNYTLEDQTVGAIFDVIPQERLEKIYAKLNGSNESPFGVRETYPYIHQFVQEEDLSEGEYHDGGIWPWLNFMDAWGRFLNGHAIDAERIIKEVGYDDLVRFNDYMPNEFLNGETGQNEGTPIQAWNSDLFSTIYFGAFGLDRVDRRHLKLAINTSSLRDFNTILRVPEGNLRVSRTDGHVEVHKDFAAPLDIKIQ